MVDMSPEAVTQRLRLMDDLWELSTKLANSRKVERGFDGESQTLEPAAPSRCSGDDVKFRSDGTAK